MVKGPKICSVAMPCQKITSTVNYAKLLGVSEVVPEELSGHGKKNLLL